MGRGLRGLLAFALLLIVTAATAWQQQPSGFRPESAPADEFSAGRALRTIEEIARAPHPVGTPEHDRVRDYLAGELRTLGLDTEIRSGIGRWPVDFKSGEIGIGRVDNIVARMRGTDSTGTVYLVAHYDSVPSGPGANDDGAGVAAIMETLRVLRHGETGLRNDVVVLLSDGEEPGLFGAEAFVAAGGYDREHSVVINHEARGAGGSPLLWRLTRPDGALIEAVAAAVPYPNTDSITTALAGEATSSTTDFVAFKPGGLRVLDWAYAGKTAYYHNRLDDPAHVNLPGLQQMGENTLAQAEEFGQKDLGDKTIDENRAYFMLPFEILVVLPLWVIIAVAVVMVAVLAWVIRQVRRNGETTLRRVLLAGVTALLALPVAVGATYGMWWVLQRVEPVYKGMPIDPYRPEFFQVAMIVLSAAALLAWFAFARKVFGAPGALIGLLSGIALIGAGLAALLPAAAAVLVIPTCSAVIGVALTFRTPERRRLPVLTVSLLPAAVFLGGNAWLGVQTGLTTAPFLTAPAVVLLGGLLLLTLARTWPAERGWTIPATAVLVTVALCAAGLAVDRFDDAHPRMTNLVYALDGDTHEARWISATTPDGWTRNYVSDNKPGAPYSDLWPSAVSSGPAPAQSLAAPTADILSDTTGSGQRTVKLRLRSPRGGTRIDLHWDVRPQSLRVGGREIAAPPEDGFRFYAPAAEGVEVELVVPAGPLSLRLTDFDWLGDSKLDAYQAPPADYYLRQDAASAVFVSVPGLR